MNKRIDKALRNQRLNKDIIYHCLLKVYFVSNPTPLTLHLLNLFHRFLYEFKTVHSKFKGFNVKIKKLGYQQYRAWPDLYWWQRANRFLFQKVKGQHMFLLMS
jgi:hypothetical protein